MHGFGAVVAEAAEPPFHEAWEGRTFALMIVTGAKGLRQGTIRAHIEAMPAADYLAASYFERWAFGVERALVETGALTAQEIDARAEASGLEAAPPAVDPAFTAGLLRALQRTSHSWPAAPRARFQVGDQVTVRRMAPAEHHRCPRYVRGVTGTVTRVAGGYPRPGGHDDEEALYTVRFAMADLWGADAEPGFLFLDLWEGYLA
jgi:nitrile hydratase